MYPAITSPRKAVSPYCRAERPAACSSLPLHRCVSACRQEAQLCLPARPILNTVLLLAGQKPGRMGLRSTWEAPRSSAGKSLYAPSQARFDQPHPHKEGEAACSRDSSFSNTHVQFSTAQGKSNKNETRRCRWCGHTLRFSPQTSYIEDISSSSQRFSES